MKKAKLKRGTYYKLGNSIEIEWLKRGRKGRKKYSVIVQGERLPITFYFFCDAQNTAFKHFKKSNEWIN